MIFQDIYLRFHLVLPIAFERPTMVSTSPGILSVINIKKCEVQIKIYKDKK